MLTISQHFESNQELTETIDGIYFAMPALLSVEFADPPYVQRVSGAVGSVGFRWELKEWKMHFRTTTQEQQESRAAVSWERIGLLSASGRRRLLAALHYFHVALRLSREGSIAGEFMPEMILNLSKVLEVLFPPDGAGRTLDAARRGLTALGFSRTEIEGDYIPAMALRNEIDVGHVVLSLFTREQLALIHGYTDHAEEAFRILIGVFSIGSRQVSSMSRRMNQSRPAIKLLPLLTDCENSLTDMHSNISIESDRGTRSAAFPARHRPPLDVTDCDGRT